MIFPNDDTSFVADHPCLACLNLSYNTSKRKRQETKKKQKNVKMRSESVIDKRRRSQEEAREKARLEENQHEMKKQWKRRQRNIIRSQEKKKAEIKMRLQNALLVEGLEQNPLILNHLHRVMRIIIIIFNLVGRGRGDFIFWCSHLREFENITIILSLTDRIIVISGGERRVILARNIAQVTILEFNMLVIEIGREMIIRLLHDG